MGDRRILGVVGVIAIAIALVAAALRLRRPREHEVSPVVAAQVEALDVELSGCGAIVRGPACEVSEGGELRLWLPGVADARITITASGRDVTPTSSTEWPDGKTLHVVAPRGATQLEVRTDRAGRAAIWSIPLLPPVATLPSVERARALRGEGKLDEAAAVLGEASSADAGARPAVLSLSARVEYARGHLDAAAARFHEAIALHAAEGRVSEAADDVFALVFLLLEQGRFGEVRPLLAQAAELSRDWPDGRANAAYNEGRLAAATGDLRLALRRSREAERHAARLGFARLRRMASQTIGVRLNDDLGRSRDALDAFRALLASDGDAMSPCDRADLLDNIGWAADLDEGSAGDAGIDPREPLRQALDVFRGACPDPGRIANALENVALAELQRGRIAEAKRALDDARKAASDPGVRVVLFWDHLAGRIALASHDARGAADAFAREADLAAALGTGEHQRLAAEDRAEALVLLGRKEDALAALDAADALLDARGAFIPLGEGKETFFGTRDRTAALRVSLLVQLGRDADAMLAARRARVRVLAGLRGAVALEGLDEKTRGQWEQAFQRYRDARESIDADAAHDWELSADRMAAALARRRDSVAAARAALDAALALLSLPREAPEPPLHSLRDGELELLYLAAPSGWLGFARDRAGTRAVTLGAVDAGAPPDALATALLGPFDGAIARASRVRLLLYGAARAVDVHALPWHGRPLIDHAPIEYALDVGDAAASRSPSADAKRALVVSDPAGDLPAARAEADTVTAAFAHGADWLVVALRGTDARGDAVRAALGDATVFHYAGHAAFGGPDGADSALPLAAGGALTPGDVLALGRVPPFVALFGCETGRESASGASDTLGLANAFLVAGSRGVVATSRVVDDGLAREVAAEMYPRLVGAPMLDFAAALRDALIAVRGRSAAVGWEAFRALAR